MGARCGLPLPPGADTLYYIKYAILYGPYDICSMPYSMVRMIYVYYTVIYNTYMIYVLQHAISLYI